MGTKLWVQQGADGLHVINFHGASIPIGFIAFHRKERHLACTSGHGFIATRYPGAEKSIKVPCECAVGRAQKKLKAVGKEAFEAEGADWLGKAKVSVAIKVVGEEKTALAPLVQAPGDE